jgi:elongation factor P
MKAYDIKRGSVVEHNGTTYIVRDVERSAPTGRGGNTTYRIQMYSVPGAIKLDLSLRAEDDLAEVDLTRRTATYSYRDGDNFVFMDAEDYTQYLLGPDTVGDLAGYITEGLENCQVMLRDELPLSLQLPQQVVLEVIDTAPELKGATATKRPKPARLNTGIEIQVPEYIVTGEKIRVSTETGEFAGRA